MVSLAFTLASVSLINVSILTDPRPGHKQRDQPERPSLPRWVMVPLVGLLSPYYWWNPTGLKQKRASPAETKEFVAELMKAFAERFPGAILQFEVSLLMAPRRADA